VQAFHAAASTPKAVRVRDGELRELLRYRETLESEAAQATACALTATLHAQEALKVLLEL
jgi:hypothetical protein